MGIITPVIVSLITTVIIAPLVGLFIQPYIESRKNRILQDIQGRKDIIALIRTVVGNLQVVALEADSNNTRLLKPTDVNVLSTRLSGIESDSREIIRLLVSIGTKRPDLRQNEGKFIKNIAQVVGGALKIKDNIESNNQHSINGENGFRGVNKTSLQKYIEDLNDVIKVVEKINNQRNIFIRISSIFKLLSVKR